MKETTNRIIQGDYFDYTQSFIDSNPSVINSTTQRGATLDTPNDWAREPSTTITNAHIASAVGSNKRATDNLNSVKSST